MTSQTRITLLERVRAAAEPAAWEEFYERYWRLIHATARRRGCSDHTAEEVVQDTMLAVFDNRDAFRYDPQKGRFRDWLGTVVRNVVARRRRSPHDRIRPLADDAAIRALADGAEPPDEAWDRAFDLATLASLLDIVRREVNGTTFQAFDLAVLHGMRGAEVASVTGLSRNAVYLARRRVLARLRELGAAAAPGATIEGLLREAAADRPCHTVERAVTVQAEQTLTQAFATGARPFPTEGAGR